MIYFFLDIDGVLNRFGSPIQNYKGLSAPLIEFTDQFIRLIDTVDSKIILSTSWRIHSHIPEYLNESLNKHLNIIGITPVLTSNTFDVSLGKRFVEINKYITDNSLDIEGNIFVIIDDLAEAFPLDVKNAKSYFCHTNNTIGLTEEDVNKLLEFINL